MLMDIFKPFRKKEKEEILLSYKPIPMTPTLAERQYEELIYRQYGIKKKHKFSTR